MKCYSLTSISSYERNTHFAEDDPAMAAVSAQLNLMCQNTNDQDAKLLGNPAVARYARADK